MRAGFEMVSSLRRFAITSLFALVLSVSVLAWPATRAAAQSNGVGIGLGVSGGLKLLNELSKGTKTKKGKSASKKTTKKTYGSKKKDNGSSTASKGKNKNKSDDESGDDTAAADDGKAKAGAKDEATVPAAAATAPAASGTAALAATGVAAAAASGEAKLISSKSEIKSAQDHLKFMGYDVPDANGTLDLKTKIAMMQFQDSIGEPSSGVLTVKQLQTLFVKVSEKTASGK